MGFLDRTAMRAERRRLAPFFRADEHFIQTDVCELIGVEFSLEGTRLPGAQVAFSMTSHAIYFRPTQGVRDAPATRLPYERIVAVIANGPFLEFTTISGGDYLFRDIGRAMGGDKYELLTIELAKREVHRQTVELADGAMEFVCRPFDEGGLPGWLHLVVRGDVDPSSPTVRAAVEAQMATAIARFGSPFTPTPAA